MSDGGRGGGRSWTFARFLLLKSLERKCRILCGREYQNSIRDSVHRLLSDQIEALGWSSLFKVTNDAIVANNGSNFIFKGLHHNASEIKSLEGVDYCWIEEAEKVSEESWSFLIPTIRKEGSEILITFNPYRESDSTYQRFIVNPPPDTVRMFAGFRENPWFPDVLKAELEHDKRTNPDRYNWIWEGKPLGLSDSQVFRGKYEVAEFEHRPTEQLFLGADWGFAQDPTTLIRCFIRDGSLYIDHEAYGVGVDIDDTPKLFDSVPESKKWKMYADCARPETISYLQRNGYGNCTPCAKWQGSVEDGIEYIKGFEKVFIHPRCKHTLEEFNLYAYKTDRVSGEILPIIVDKNNHCIDALRYALNDRIKFKDVVVL